MPNELIKHVSDSSFETDVLQSDKPVLVDFWAEWCGPCKALGPVLEKVAADYASRGVVLVKIDVDEQKLIAAQFRVQSIPTVYAFFQGQPVDAFQGAVPQSQVKQFVEKLAAMGGDDGG